MVRGRRKRGPRPRFKTPATMSTCRRHTFYVSRCGAPRTKRGASRAEVLLREAHPLRERGASRAEILLREAHPLRDRLRWGPKVPGPRIQPQAARTSGLGSGYCGHAPRDKIRATRSAHLIPWTGCQNLLLLRRGLIYLESEQFEKC